MRNRSIANFLLIFALLIVISPRLSALEDLVQNGGFETDELGMLSMWSMDAWINTEAAVRFFATEQFMHSGRRSFAIANLQPNDSRAVQWISVKPDTLYRFSAWIMAKDVVSEGMGANLSVLGSTSAAGDLKDTGGEWRYAELYGRTGPRQKSLAVLLRLGFYGSLATGIAMFDDAKLEELSSLPEGAQAISLGDNTAAEVFPVVTSSQAAPESPKAAPKAATPWAVMLVLSALAAATVLVAGAVVLMLFRVRGMPPTVIRQRPAGKVTLESLIAKERADIAHPSSSSWGYLKPSLRGKHRRDDALPIEHRESPRAPFAAWVTVRTSRAGSHGELRLQSENMSKSGILLASSDLDALRLDEEVVLTAEGRAGTFEIGRAIVTRVHGQVPVKGKTQRGGFGLRFTSIDFRIQRGLKALPERTPD